MFWYRSVARQKRLSENMSPTCSMLRATSDFTVFLENEVDMEVADSYTKLSIKAAVQMRLNTRHINICPIDEERRSHNSM